MPERTRAHEEGRVDSLSGSRTTKIDELTLNLRSYAELLATEREAVTEPIVWYRYDILSNLVHLEALLSGEHRDLSVLAGSLPVADIGGADGDLAFFLERAAGLEVDIIDTAATNQNGLRGARLLKQRLGSNVRIHDIDLDDRFSLPRDRYGLVLLLGILYHLQNPFYMLRELSRHSSFCIMSSRVARLAGKDRLDISALPVGYLVGPRNSTMTRLTTGSSAPPGLRRIVERAGWSVASSLNVGNTAASVPDSNEGDERMFMLLRSTVSAS